MTTFPPDPAAAYEAELRSEDDGMPIHPAEADDPVAYADTHEERERAAAAGYPAHPVARAVTDANHLITAVVDDLMAPRNRVVVTVAGLVGFGLAALLLQRSYQASLRRFASRGW
jgi:hypothetical protein